MSGDHILTMGYTECNSEKQTLIRLNIHIWSIITAGLLAVTEKTITSKIRVKHDMIPK
jgi:hypothetical protein